MKRNKPQPQSGLYVKTRTQRGTEEHLYLNGKEVIIYIGIDPGSVSGGLAWIETKHPYPANALQFKDQTWKDLCDSIGSMLHITKNICAVIEEVHTMPKQGVVSSGKLMENYGMLQGFLMAFDIPFKKVRPQVWQKHYSMKKHKDEPQSAWKRRLRQRAQELYPDVQVKAETADALLIANYCMETWNVRS